MLFCCWIELPISMSFLIWILPLLSGIFEILCLVVFLLIGVDVRNYRKLLGSLLYQWEKHTKNRSSYSTATLYSIWKRKKCTNRILIYSTVWMKQRELLSGAFVAATSASAKVSSSSSSLRTPPRVACVDCIVIIVIIPYRQQQQQQQQHQQSRQWYQHASMATTATSNTIIIITTTTTTPFTGGGDSYSYFPSSLYRIIKSTSK